VVGAVNGMARQAELLSHEPPEMVKVGVHTRGPRESRSISGGAAPDGDTFRPGRPQGWPDPHHASKPYAVHTRSTAGYPPWASSSRPTSPSFLRHAPPTCRLTCVHPQ
jgi:hypothetical protein